ncbi:MAG: hypothetical protein KDA53_15645 [Hyphomonas sp.]|nr:hypothetical protein [Hyphomonas sp.]
MRKNSKLEPSERRRRAVIVTMLILLTSGVGAVEAISDHSDHLRSVDFARGGSLLFLALVIALRATTNFRFGRSDPALDDELTASNRASAATWGFWAVMTTLACALLVNLRWPLSVAETVPILIATGAVSAGIRFVFLERQGI